MTDTGNLIFYMIADWKINEWQIFNKKRKEKETSERKKRAGVYEGIKT